jgi:hypothetical protein
MTLGNENIGASFWRGNINAKGLKEISRIVKERFFRLITYGLEW